MTSHAIPLLAVACLITACHVAHAQIGTGPGIVFLRREDGSQNFSLPFADYQAGFGDPAGEFWLGLDDLYALTKTGTYGLRVDMTSWDDVTLHATYSYFRVDSPAAEYRLFISGYDASSTAGDSLAHSATMPFSTWDSDNDALCWTNCAHDRKGGWWYRSCGSANPTGLYIEHVPSYHQGNRAGMVWYTAFDDWATFKAMTCTLVRQ